MKTWGGQAVAVDGAHLDPAFQVAHDLGADVDGIQLVDVVDAARREHVDLQHFVADEIDAHEIQTVSDQPRAQQRADAAPRRR